MLGPESVDTSQSHAVQLEYLESIGCIAGTDAPGVLTIADHSPQGPLEIVRNPAVELLLEPEIWPVWNEFRLGIRDTYTPQEYFAEASGFEVDCLLTLRHARMREDDRVKRAKAATEPYG